MIFCVCWCLLFPVPLPRVRQSRGEAWESSCVCIASFHAMSSTRKLEGGDGVVEPEQHESSGEELAGLLNIIENPFASFAFGGGATAVPASAPAIRPPAGNKRKSHTGKRRDSPGEFE